MAGRAGATRGDGEALLKGFPGKVSGGRVRGGGWAALLPLPQDARAWVRPRLPAGAPGLPWGKERPENFAARKSGKRSTRCYAVGCFLPLET